MSEPFPLEVAGQFNPSLPTPSPASASTSTLISPYPISCLSKEVDEDIPSSMHTTTVLEAPDNSTSILSNPSTRIDTPVTPVNRPQPPNMSFASLDLHAQALGHTVTQRERPSSVSRGFGGGGMGQGDANEAKMSWRGFVQPHRNHLPRRVKPKSGTATPQSSSPAPLPSTTALLSLTRPALADAQEASERSRPPPHSANDAPTTTLSFPGHAINNLTPDTFPSGSGKVGGDIASANLDPSVTPYLSPASAPTNPSTPTPVPRSSSSTIPPPHTLPESHSPVGVVAVPIPIPPALTPRPDRRPFSTSLNPSPLGPNFPRRKLSRRGPALPLSDPAFDDTSSLSDPSAPVSVSSPLPSYTPAPARTASPAQTPTPTPSSRPVTTLRSSLRTPGKTPLRSAAALAESPFASSSSESESDRDGGKRSKDRGKFHTPRSDTPQTSAVVILGSTPVHTPAQGVTLAPPSVPTFMNIAAAGEAEGGGRRHKEKGRRRTTFALPFPIHGERRSQAAISPLPPPPAAAADGNNGGEEIQPEERDEVERSLPARLAVASLRNHHVPPTAEEDKKCSQYVGVGIYVGFLEDDQYEGESFWDVPALDDTEGGESSSLDEDEKEIGIERLRRIVLRVLLSDDDAGDVDEDLVVNVVEEVPETEAHANPAPSLPSPSSSSDSDSTENLLNPPALSSDGSSSQSDMPHTPPSPSSSSSPPVSSSTPNAGNLGHNPRKEKPERELVLTLPPPEVSSSLLAERVLKAETGTGRAFAGSGYVDGMSVLGHAEMHEAWKWMKGWMSALDVDVEEDMQEEAQDDGEEDKEERRARSRSRARSTNGKEGMLDDDKSRSKSRRRSTHCHGRPRRRRRRPRRCSNVQIEILSPRERREDAMGLALGYLYLALSPGQLPIEELGECLNHGDERAYTPMHLMWMRLMDVGVRLDDHGDDRRVVVDGSRKRSRSRKRSASRKRIRSRSRPRQVDDVDVDVDVDLDEEKDEQDKEKPDVKPENSSNEVQIERELDPIPPFRFNTDNIYPPSSSSRSSLCSYSDHCSSGYPCGYTDEDQPSDSAPPAPPPPFSRSVEHLQLPNSKAPTGRILSEEYGQVDDEGTGEQITLHDIRDEWRGVFSFDGLGVLWESVQSSKLASP